MEVQEFATKVTATLATANTMEGAHQESVEAETE